MTQKMTGKNFASALMACTGAIAVTVTDGPNTVTVTQPEPLAAKMRTLEDEIRQLSFDGLPEEAHKRGFETCRRKVLALLSRLPD